MLLSKTRLRLKTSQRTSHPVTISMQPHLHEVQCIQPALLHDLGHTAFQVEQWISTWSSLSLFHWLAFLHIDWITFLLNYLLLSGQWVSPWCLSVSQNWVFTKKPKRKKFGQMTSIQKHHLVAPTPHALRMWRGTRETPDLTPNFSTTKPTTKQNNASLIHIWIWLQCLETTLPIYTSWVLKHTFMTMPADNKTILLTKSIWVWESGTKKSFSSSPSASNTKLEPGTTVDTWHNM